MNIPTHYNAMSDSDVLRDLYARNYHNDPLLEYVCQRWELLVEGEKDWEEQVIALTDAKDWLQDEVHELRQQVDRLEKEVDRLESRGDEELE